MDMEKQTIKLTGIVMAACAAALALLWGLNGGPTAHAAPGADIQVCPSGCAHSSIQEAVDAANPGDVIKVAQGIYTDVHVRKDITQVVYLSKTVAIRGGYTTTNWTTPYPITQPTTLDARGQGRGMVITGTITPSIEGLRITGGDATGLGGGPGGGDVGGGIYIYLAEATITDTTVYSNTAPIGGGLYLNESDSTLNGNRILNNTASGNGGGIYFQRSSARLNRNLLYHNGSSIGGGGLYIGASSATLSGNRIYSNTATTGGGVQTSSSADVLDGNFITDNVAIQRGGGLYIERINTTGLSPALTNNFVSDNRVVQTAGEGAGIYIFGSSPILQHNTIARNSGGDGSGIYVTEDDIFHRTSSLSMINSIIVSHTVGITVTAGNTATLDSTLWHANAISYTTGGGSISSTNDYTGDPAFAPDGYHLTDSSAAIDRGIVIGISTDIDGETRPQGSHPDLGADEFTIAPPEGTWKKHVRIDDGPFQAWDSGPFTVEPGDLVTVVDRVLVTYTADVTFTLEQTWGADLALEGRTSDGGTIISSTSSLTWQGDGLTAGQWYRLTSTLRAGSGDWLQTSLTETLAIEGAVSQPTPRVLRLSNPAVDTGCYARVNDGTTTHTTLQAAVDAAQANDLVKVAGVCTTINHRGGLTQVVYISKTVTVRGGYTTTNWTTPDPTAHPTTLDAQGQGRVLVIVGNTVNPTIEGLRITGGTTPDPLDRGAGIYVEEAGGVISGNLIYSNTLDYYGAGVYLSWSSVRLIHNDVMSNTTSESLGRGGGIYLNSGTPEVSHNRIMGNAALEGGGVHISGEGATLMDNAITDNEAGFGGGVYIINGNPTLERNVIGRNTASSGGGLYVWHSEARIVNNAIVDNEGTWYGAGVCVVQGAAPRLIHTTIARNSGGGTGDGSGVTVVDDTSNPGTGVASAILMTNTILVDHTIGITVASGCTATLEATLWHANSTDRDGAGTIDHTSDHTGDPAFAADGYHVGEYSAALNQGVNAGVTTDIDGDTRPIDDAYDIGADERAASYTIYLPLVLRNG